MSLDLIVANKIDSTPQQVGVQDDSSKSALWLSPNNIYVGQVSNSHCILGVYGNAPSNGTHLELGNPTATSGLPSAKLTFAGNNILHAGFSWVPGSDATQGYLNLSFGGSEDPSQNPTKISFQSNGNLNVNGSITASRLDALTLSTSNLILTNLTTPPSGVGTVDLVVDPKTGKIYRQG